ncbi:hypothetical protein D1814_04055 [Alteromonas sp. BL110]|uniref:hypothetical protein n=1 Tax=Alteromonas sp. BL110 TaxID=1714845 RepID=UPI000E5020E7|nr:hypothetical protein [Alteromonas sp. BL110]AXT37906.1 hypothetical protein D1814_04055 [Alteromonas sp. BL110]RKM80646.1 hypothetical protein D7031_17400 [Alteromonas sp. BL110]
MDKIPSSADDKETELRYCTSVAFNSSNNSNEKTSLCSLNFYAARTNEPIDQLFPTLQKTGQANR